LSVIQKRINVPTDVFSAIQNRNDSTERIETIQQKGKEFFSTQAQKVLGF
nr:hypothetical protein [Tanacetum cinerariifolium]